MEVTIVSAHDMYASKPGGTQVYVTDLINSLLKRNIKVVLIGTSHNTKNNTTGHPFTFIPIARNEKITGYNFLFRLLLKSVFLKIAKQSIIDTQRPDIMLPFILFHRKNPKICTLHGFVHKGIYYKKGKIVGTIYDLIESFTLKRVNKIIAVNESTRDYYIKMYPWLKDKIVVIPVGIDTEKFRPMNKQEMRKKYGFKQEDEIILYVGRLEKEKGLELLLKAFKEVEKGLKEIKIVFIGDGRARKNLENMVKDIELKEVIFLGNMKHEEIPEIMNCADIFVLSSLYESGPLVVQEALACGIPVVTTDVGRVSDFIKNEFMGRIVDRNEKNFAVAITEMLNMDQEKTRTACRKVAMDFSFEKTANKTIEICKHLQKEL